MYGAFFGLKKQPFASVPQTDQYFPASAIEAARVSLTRCIERGEGVGMVVGPTGTGKSLLCRMLAEQFKDIFPVAELSCGRLSTRRSLFQAVLYKLGQAYRGMDEGELRIALVDYLTLGKSPYRGMVLIVDESHTLPLRLLDEIRMMTNLAGQGRPLVRLVLAGNGSLEELLLKWNLSISGYPRDVIWKPSIAVRLRIISTPRLTWRADAVWICLGKIPAKAYTKQPMAYRD